jgi:hypothetical protein
MLSWQSAGAMQLNMSFAIEPQQIFVLSWQSPPDVRGTHCVTLAPASSPVAELSSPASVLLLAGLELEPHATTTAATSDIELTAKRMFALRILVTASSGDLPVLARGTISNAEEADRGLKLGIRTDIGRATVPPRRWKTASTNRADGNPRQQTPCPSRSAHPRRRLRKDARSPASSGKESARFEG